MTPHYTDPWLTVYAGDNRDVLATLPDESVHCVVTSPPYWGLRDYGTATWDGGNEGCDHLRAPGGTGGDPRYGPNKGNAGGAPTPMGQACDKCGARRIDNQLGLEPTPEQYVENMVAVFREVRRVLRRDGTLWLNLGDSYASGEVGRHDRSNGYEGEYQRPTRQGERKQARLRSGLKPKDLVGIPWRVAFALQADGWYLRSDIIWAKPNPMPESVTDRPTKSHEYLFLLAKSERYYFDADAVREPHADGGAWIGRAPVVALKANGDRNDAGAPPTTADPAGRNIRSVWTIATQPYPGAHFAVFPPALVEPCVKAGTSERGVCPECGAPWRRVVERGFVGQSNPFGPGQIVQGNRTTLSGEQMRRRDALRRREESWQPSCAHDAAPVPATCLDLFAGSGTVGMVAQRLSRRAILIDLNPSYIEQQLRRNRDVPLGLVG